MKKVFIIIIIVAITSFSCKNIHVIQLANNSKAKNNTVPYFLPKTILSIDLTITKTSYLKGPFAAFSAKYTGISSVINENKSEFEITDVTITPSYVADNSKTYAIVLPKCKKKIPQLKFSEDGLLNSINVDEDLTTIKSDYNAKKNIIDKNDNNIATSFKYFASENIKLKTDTVFEKIIHDTITIEKQTLKHSVIEKSMEDKAKDVADYLKLIAENKMNILSGYQEIGYDVNTIKFMYQELEKTEEDYLCLFKGKKIEQPLHYRFTIVPDTNILEKNIFLFQFDTKDGLTYDKNSDSDENNIYCNIVSAKKTTLVEKLSPKKNKNGIYYNIPENAKICILNANGDILFESLEKINQFGKILSLPRNVNAAIFDQSSGSLKVLK